ncbi:MAG: regulatory protein RecX [Gemmatimonadales bacterium]|nr:regulatory protein RecX [Gemmatimonadales bacterium]
MRVTALDIDPREPGVVRIEVDGGRFGAVSGTVVAGEGIRVGADLDSEQGQRLSEAADREAAYHTILRALGRRAYARADLARRLVRRGHAKDAVEAGLVRAEAAGFLDDAAYALHYVQTRAPNGRGPARLVRDLLSRGVDRALVDRAIAIQWPDGSDRGAAAFALAEKRAAQLGALPRQAKRRRLLAYLARRGYTGHQVTEIVGKVVP